MTIAQTKAARRKFQTYYRRDTPIGTPHYGRKSTDKLARREAEQRERIKMLMARKGKKGKK